MAYQNGPRIVTDGLLFNFDASSNKSITTGSTVWKDLSVNKHTATLLNGASFVSGSPSYVNFDGADDWARIDFPSAITLSTYTHDYWVYKPGYASGYNTIVDFGNDRNAVMTNNNAILHFNPTIGANYTIPFGFPTWTNIVVSHAFGGPFYFYINGELTSTSGNNSTVHSGISSAGIGGGITGPTTADERWVGRMNIIRFYLNKALTPEEIRQNYNATKGRFKL